MQLPVANLRAQTYDGAANMAGAYNHHHHHQFICQPSESTECSCHLQHLSIPGGQHLC